MLLAAQEGLWGINVDATRTHIAAPSFKDRAFLFKRNSDGTADQPVGALPLDTYGANSIAVLNEGSVVVSSHDDGRLRFRDARTGAFIGATARNTASLLMGVAVSNDIVASIDFYGEIFFYSTKTRELLQRLKVPFGPGISLSFNATGKFLAAGGYRWDGYVLVNEGKAGECRFKVQQRLEGPNKGVLKQVCFGQANTIYGASGDGTAVQFQCDGNLWSPKFHFRAEPHMELCNGIAEAPRLDLVFVVSRDQTVRSFCTRTGAAKKIGYGHTRSVKTIAYNEKHNRLVTGSYDRTLLIWDAHSLQPVAPPIRFANSGFSFVTVNNDNIYGCSFDGVVGCWSTVTGEHHWTKSSFDHRAGT